MGLQIITASGMVQAPASLVYGIIADYHDGHPHILPKQYFPSLVVEEGGIGAGTRIRFEMKAMGRVTTTRAVITEPEPGRILVESSPESGVVTTFLVEPVQANQAKVTFTTELKTRDGFLGRIEGFMAKLFLNRVYAEELAILAAFAKERAAL